MTPSLRWAGPLTAASGFAGLGYQIVWTQQHALWLGHEAAAVLAVVTAFFGGLAVGAGTLSARILRSPHPARWYAGCELVIALWSGVMLLGLAPYSQMLLTLTGPQPSPAWQWGVALLGTFLALLPATAAMGATLPALDRLLASLLGAASPLAGLYASNTLGAVAGVLATAFWLIPGIGLAGTVAVCAAVNLACATGALALARHPPQARPVPARAALPCPAQGLWLRLAATGLLGVGYEVLVVRAISQVAENTVYTFAILLALYLVGSALGAAAWQRWAPQAVQGDGMDRRLLLALSAACAAGGASLWWAEPLLQGVQAALGPAGMAASLTAEAALAATAFLLPTVLMGALFSHLCLQARSADMPWGRSLCANTLGAALAPSLFGVVVIPALGLKGGVLVIAAAYLALARSRAWRRPMGLALAASLASAAVWAPPLRHVDLPEGGQIVSYREGAMAAVSVVADAQGVSRLRIDNRQQEGSSHSLLADARQALLPLLLHPAPRRALFLGLGTGVTATSAALDPSLQVDAAELLPEVIEASSHFTQPMLAGASPRLRVSATDARRFVRAAGEPYDLIISDNFHPARSGSGALYTVEHFQAVRARLSAEGIFCQWLPLHQLDLATLRSIVRSFQMAFPGGWALLATHSLDTPVIGLLARSDGGRLRLPALRQRLARHALPQALADYGIDDETALLGGFLAGPSALAAFAGNAQLNTDDHPVVSYLAPRITYAPDSRPRDRLQTLLGQVRLSPAELLDGPAEPAAALRLAAYWQARDQFIAAGLSVRPSRDVRLLLAQVQAPLLQVLQTSPDFRPAYDPLLRMALALGPQDRAGARALLQALMARQPARPEALQALQHMNPP